LFLQPLLCIPSSDAPSGMPPEARGAEDVWGQVDAVEAQMCPFFVHFLILGLFYHGHFSPTWHTETWWDHTTIWGQQRKRCATQRAFSASTGGFSISLQSLLWPHCSVLLPAPSQPPPQAFLDDSCVPCWPNAYAPLLLADMGWQHMGLAGRALTAIGSRISSSCGIPVFPHALPALFFLCSLPTLQQYPDFP